MSAEYLFGFDCGTYESKGVICDLNGKIMATASERHLLLMPKPGYAEHDPIKEWWHDFITITTRLLEQTGIKASQLAAIGISTVMAAIVPVDDEMRPLRNAILYGIDTRSVGQADKLNATIGAERVRAISGAPCTSESFGPKILWIKENEPNIYARAKHFTIASGFLTAKLTGCFAVDRYSVNAAQPMLDARTMEWSEELCDYVCPASMLPRIAWTTDVVGTVTSEAARETGLAAGTPVICGTTDGGAESVSIGVVEPGDTMIMYGSTAFINRLSLKMPLGCGIWSGSYVIDGLFCNTAGMATTGSLTRWVRDNFAKDLLEQEKLGTANAYDQLFNEAQNIPAGSDGLILLPYFLGERMPIQDPNAKGVIFGLNLRHTRGHIMHAAMEGVGFGLAQICDLFGKSGIPVKKAIAVGGGARNTQWVQIVSDICGITQIIPRVTIGAAYGDALLAGLGIGAISSESEIKKMNCPEAVFEPRHDSDALYAKYKQIYKALYENNKGSMHQL